MTHAACSIQPRIDRLLRERFKIVRLRSSRPTRRKPMYQNSAASVLTVSCRQSGGKTGAGAADVTTAPVPIEAHDDVNARLITWRETRHQSKSCAALTKHRMRWYSHLFGPKGLLGSGRRFPTVDVIQGEKERESKRGMERKPAILVQSQEEKHEMQAHNFSETETVGRSRYGGRLLLSDGLGRSCQ